MKSLVTLLLAFGLLTLRGYPATPARPDKPRLLILTDIGGDPNDQQSLQHEFAARLDWCLADAFNRANHGPVAVLNGDKTKSVIQLTAKPGETIRLSAEGTSDSDGNAIEMRWWIYPEAALGSSLRRLLCLPLLVVGDVQEPSLVKAAETAAVRAEDFLRSIGVCSTVSRRGENLSNTVNAARYLGVRWFRAGYESRIPVADLIELHRQTGVRFSYGLMSGGTNIARLLDGARQLAAAGALIALEGNNEPNNWGVTYEGQRGGRTNSWLPVAKLQRDLYRAVKSDPVLKDYPVWSLSENGAETDNVGLQFLTIPSGAGTLMPDDTKYADYANCHNYMTHPGWPGLHDNQTWIAADPTSACRVDGLYGNYGRTWRHRYPGYSEASLETLPRVTTETGITIRGPITEQVQALLYLSVYLDQFKRGWKHTAIYLLRDRTDESGNQTFGFYKPDYTPRMTATYLHNLTTILADKASAASPGKLTYSIPSQPATVHDLLLQKSDGKFELVVWDERFAGGSDNITVKLAAPATTAMLFDPTTGTSAIRCLTNVSSVTLTLSNHPVIIELSGPTRLSGAKSAKPSPSPSVETGILTGLGQSLKIRASSSSFEGLVRLTRPTFTWKDCELLWIHKHTPRLRIGGARTLASPAYFEDIALKVQSTQPERKTK